MTVNQLVVAVVGALLLLLLASTAEAQPRPTTGTLRVVVKDPSGAVIPNARLRVTGRERATEAIDRRDLVTDAVGVTVAADLVPGHYAIQASFSGFETTTIPDVRVRTGENRREIVLPIQKLDESVSVGRDPATAASDPRNDRGANVLSTAQIDALPDDPDEMEKVLTDMAGPGAAIRVDGFRGGKLPPKSQIRSIRFSTGQFAAENHAGGMTFVDISTQPGLGPLRGSLDFGFRNGALNARNAFQQDKGAEQTQQYTFNLGGTLRKERTSFSLTAGGASLYDSAYVFAALPGGGRNEAVRRPSDRTNVSARLDHALTKAHALRATVQQNGNDQRNLGVGTYDLPERAFSRSTDDSLLRVSESGAWARNWFGESRLQLHWTSTDAASAFETPTVRVLDAFTSGGAQQAGGRHSSELEWATTVDWTRGRHAVRMGTLVEAGRYRGDSRTNYLGTYTFSSLADFDAGRPATYTRRVGDPLVAYTQWQAGLFVQDDWRVRKNLTLSGGVRHEVQTNLGDHLNVAPRGGLTWSPFKDGKTTVRAGGGLFSDWLDADVYEQTLRVDGVRQQDLVVRNPAFPDPLSGGAGSEVLPTSKYALATGLRMPTRLMVNAGISRQLTPSFTLNANLMHSRGSDRLRGRDVNAPDAGGERPDPAFGTVTEVESTGRSRGVSMNVGANLALPNRRTFVFANYAWLRQRNDADGPFGLPANSYDVAAEWGPASGVPRHIASAVINTALPKGLRLGVTAAGRSGIPYNVTTGRDDNGDTVFNDRPAGIGRNSARGKATWDMAARLSYAFGFGQRTAAGPNGAPTIVIRRIGDTAGDLLGGMPGGGGADNKRIGFELLVSAQNLLNRVNPMGYSGVLTSPFFGLPTAAGPARKLDVGVKLLF